MDTTLDRVDARPEPTSREKRITLISILVVFFLSALDQTIVATAMPRIVADLQGLDVYAWVTTSYLLMSTVLVPIWGKLGDMYGRRNILIYGVSIFVVGSWLCGIAGEFGDMPLIGDGMTQLIIFRGIQGIGGGALFTTAFAILADLFPPRERAKYAGLLGGVFGLSSVLGPIIGGWFTDHGTVEIAGLHVAGWRWVFYVNLPTALPVLALIIAKMPDLGVRTGGKIDFPGALLIMASLGALMLGLTWGPTEGWTSYPVIISIFIAVGAGISFIAIERLADNPILPLSLFNNKAFSTTMIAGAVMGVAFMGTIVYLPVFLQLSLGVGATHSGLTMMPLMGGLIVGAAFSGRTVTRTGEYRPVLVLGAVVLLAGLFLMSRLNENSAPWDVVWRLALVGFGVGPSQSVFNIIAQSAAPLHQVGVATSTTMFIRQTGGVLGVSIFGAVLSAQLAGSLRRILPPGMEVDLGEMRSFAMQGEGQAPDIHPILSGAFAEAMSYIFIGAIITSFIGLLAILMIPKIELRGRGPEPVKQAAET